MRRGATELRGARVECGLGLFCGDSLSLDLCGTLSGELGRLGDRQGLDLSEVGPVALDLSPELRRGTGQSGRDISAAIHARGVTTVRSGERRIPPPRQRVRYRGADGLMLEVRAIAEWVTPQGGGHADHHMSVLLSPGRAVRPLEGHLRAWRTNAYTAPPAGWFPDMRGAG